MIFQYQERNQICNLKIISQGYNGVKNKTIYFYSIGYVKFAGLRQRNPYHIWVFKVKENPCHIPAVEENKEGRLMTLVQNKINLEV